MDDLTLASFFEAWELFRDATLAGTLLGALLGALGVYVVMRRMIFLSASLSQIAGLGIATSMWLKTLAAPLALTQPLVGGIVATASALAWVGRADPRDHTRRDAMLGTLFLIGSAGTVLLGTRIVEELQDIEVLMFGSAVAVLPEDFLWVVWAFAVVGALHVVAHRGFLAVSVDRADAQIRGLPARTLEYVLLGSLAATIALSTRIIGALPTFAFSVLPALAATRIAPNSVWAMIVAAVIGGLAGFVGYLVAFVFQFPVGASQACVAVAFVAVATIVGRLRR